MPNSFPVLGVIILVCILIALALWDIIKMLQTKSISEEESVTREEVYKQDAGNKSNKEDTEGDGKL